jgi:hypothetical protein
LAPETAGAPICSSVGPKSGSSMEIGNGASRKSAKKRQNAPLILSRRSAVKGSRLGLDSRREGVLQRMRSGPAGQGSWSQVGARLSTISSSDMLDPAFLVSFFTKSFGRRGTEFARRGSVD